MFTSACAAVCASSSPSHFVSSQTFAPFSSSMMIDRFKGHCLEQIDHASLRHDSKSLLVALTLAVSPNLTCMRKSRFCYHLYYWLIARTLGTNTAQLPQALTDTLSGVSSISLNCLTHISVHQPLRRWKAHHVCFKASTSRPVGSPSKLKNWHFS